MILKLDSRTSTWSVTQSRFAASLRVYDAMKPFISVNIYIYINIYIYKMSFFI